MFSDLIRVILCFFFLQISISRSPKSTVPCPTKENMTRATTILYFLLHKNFTSFVLCLFRVVCLEWEGQWGLQNVHSNFINKERKRYAPKRKEKEKGHIVEVIGCLQSKGSMRRSCSLAIAIPVHRQVGHITYINKEHD